MRRNLKEMQDYKIQLIDFNDSFAQNIRSELHRFGLRCEILNYSSLGHEFDFSKRQVIILGPGPGHPDDYKEVTQTLLRQIMGRKNIYLMGICLGHQIILRYLGYEVKRRESPKHGQSRGLNLPKWRELEHAGDSSRLISVQEYNSLIVLDHQVSPKINHDTFSDNGEILMSRGENFVTYQFHPESVGTSNSGVFFSFLKKWIDEND